MIAKNLIFKLFFLLLASSSIAQNKKNGKPVQKSKNNTPKPAYRYVERMPYFDTIRNGPLAQYLTSRVLTAAGSLRSIGSEKVVVQFRIAETGKVENPRVVKSAGSAFDSAALHLMSTMPDWVPAKDSGKNISIDYTLPIRVY